MADVKLLKQNDDGSWSAMLDDGRIGTYDDQTRTFKPLKNAQQEAADLLDLPGPDDAAESEGWQAQAKTQMLNPGFGGMMPLGPGGGQPSQSQEVPAETAATMGRGAASAAMAGPFGPLGMAMGAGGEAASTALSGPPQGTAGLGAEAGGTVGNIFANVAQKALESRVPGSRVLGAGLRAMGVQGLGTGLGMALGQEAEEAILGQKQPTASGGAAWVLPAAAGLVAGATAGTAASLTKYFDNIQVSPNRLTQSLNDLRTTKAGSEIPLSVSEAVQSPRLREMTMTRDWAEKVSAGADKYLQELFPSQLSNRAVLGIHKTLKTIAKFPAEGKAPKPGSFAEELTAGLTKRQLALYKAFINSDPRRADALLRSLFASDDTLNMLQIIKKAVRITGDEGILEPLENEWIVRELVMKSASVTSVAKTGLSVPGAGGTEQFAVVNGRKMLERINQIGAEKIDDVFGPKRAKALQVLADTMEFMKPETGVSQGPGFMARALNYNANRAMFVIANVGAGAAIGAGAATLLSLPPVAVGAGVAIGLTSMTRAILNNPSTATLLLKAAQDPTGSAVQPFMRALIAGQTDPGLPSGQTPPALRSTR